jgi:hypothetical protein
MYQALIWLAVERDQPRRLGAPLDAKDLESLANSLVDGVRRNVQFGRDFLRRQMLVDELQAIELAARQPRDALRNRSLRRAGRSPARMIRHA